MRFEITVKMALAADPMFYLRTVVTHFSNAWGYKRCIFEQARVVSESVEEHVPTETRRKERQGRIKSCTSGWWPHTFSAFWLRSSVVSVLTSLISGTGTTGPYQDYPNLLNHRAGSRGLPRPVRK